MNPNELINQEYWRFIIMKYEDDYDSTETFGGWVG